MEQAIWSLAKLNPEQERLIKEAEAALGAGVLLAFAPTRAAPTELSQSQLECLHGLEQKLGLVVVAVRSG